jgi:CxxC motif-containing protein (DUF1111 family)
MLVCLSVVLVVSAPTGVVRGQNPPPVPLAPAAFDNQTNGFLSQFQFDQARAVFEKRKEPVDGLGPLYNAQACAECHQNPVSGGLSQIMELRAGRKDATGQFIPAPGGSVINDRAIHPSIQETVRSTESIRSLRTSLNTLGGGFVEAIDDNTLIAIANSQPEGMRGQVILVPVLEAGGILRVGRFGWKNQHASLVSFSADAFLNEMGITSPLLPTENTSRGGSVAAFDAVQDPEDSGAEVQALADFMRATKAPPRDQALATTLPAITGALLFNQVGCATCHVVSITTAPPGTAVNGSTFIVPDALGDKTIQPYSDFLLHDIGTGDGIVQNGPPETANKMRTAPLWGVRTRTRLMHDGQSLTFEQAISRHRNEAQASRSAFNALTSTQKQNLITFLRSL